MKAEKTVDYHIKTAWHAISRMYNTYASQNDMTMSIGYVLLNIDKNGTPATKIAPALGLEPRSLTRMLKSLEERGWITREIDDNDKRIVNVKLTALGKEKRDFARKGVIAFNSTVQEIVSPAQFDEFVIILQKISKIVEEASANYKEENQLMIVE